MPEGRPAKLKHRADSLHAQHSNLQRQLITFEGLIALLLVLISFLQVLI